jgi:gentisate 1,2-dioxygenase
VEAAPDEADEDLVLFSYWDKAAQQKLNLWREELL